MRWTLAPFPLKSTSSKDFGTFGALSVYVWPMVNDLYCTFSIYRHMLEPKSWGDAIVIKTASVLWGIRITVLQSTVSGPIEHRFRHKKKLNLCYGVYGLLCCKALYLGP